LGHRLVVTPVVAFIATFVATLRMIKFEHSVFALPFAFLGALLAVEGWPGGEQILWIVVAMVGARSAAMTFNRLIDRHIDRANPRTANRELPTQQISYRFAWFFTVGASLLVVVAAWRLNPLAFRLSPLVLAILFFYSYTKRFTQFSHLVLGFCLGMAPVGAWIALRGRLGWEDSLIVLLGLAVMCWVAGFDIIYACQDVEYDRRAGLFSLPARWGLVAALRVARLLHLVMVGLLAVLVWLFPLGLLAWLGLLLVASLLVWEHSLVRAHDLSRVNAAFFAVNGYIGILLLLFWGADIVL